MKELLIWTVVIIAILAIGPLLSIWALNTLFPVLNIPYTLETWSAVVLIKGLLTVNVTNKK
jgi:hypothetical protein